MYLVRACLLLTLIKHHKAIPLDHPLLPLPSHALSPPTLHQLSVSFSIPSHAFQLYQI